MITKGSAPRLTAWPAITRLRRPFAIVEFGYRVRGLCSTLEGAQTRTDALCSAGLRQPADLFIWDIRTDWGAVNPYYAPANKA